MTIRLVKFGTDCARNVQVHKRHPEYDACRAAGGMVLWWMLACVMLAWCPKAYGMTGNIIGRGQDLPSIEMAEFLRLGEGDNGDSILFGSISSIAVDGAGRIFVGERQDPKVYVYSDEGKHLTTIGSRGAAPGEFSAISGVYIGPADSLYVFDGWDWTRLTVFEPKHYRLAYTVPIQRSESGAAVDFLGVTSESLVFTYYRSTDLATENERRFSDVFLVDWNGDISSDRLLAIERNEVFMVIIPPGGVRAMTYPFGRASTIRLSANHTVYSGWNDAVDIAITGLGGTALGQITYPQSPVRVTAADRRAVFQQRGGDAIRDRLSARDLHDTWPVYETFVVDEHGSVWLELVGKDEDETASWLVLNAHGQAIGIAALPATFELSVVRSGRIYGADRNESGAPIVVGYELLD